MNIKSIAVAALVTALALPAFAQPGPGRMGRGEGQPGYQQQIMERLNLSDAQKSAMEALRARHRAEMRLLRETLAAKALEYKRLADAGDPRASAVREEVVRLREEIAIRRTAGRAEMLEILTPEQREQLREMREDCQQGRRPGRP